MTSDGRFAANLQNVGMVLGETEALLSAQRDLGDWAKVRTRTLDENLLNKRSTTTVRHILKVVRRRYLEPPAWLPRDAAFSFFAAPNVPQRAKAQVAFLYTLAEDDLARTCLQRLVLDGPVGRFLHPNDVIDLLDVLGASHDELVSWKPYLKRRWAQGFLSLLRDGGFVEAVPSQRLIKPVILPEGFALVFPWLVVIEGSARSALSHPALFLWGLDDAAKASLLREGQQRGWWRYTAAGSMVEFHPQYSSVEELAGALG